MKKIIGYIGSHSCFSIGNMVCKISYLKVKGEFYFDREGIRYKIGYWLATQYQIWMHRSVKIQEWAGNKTPWRKITKEDSIL